MIAILFAYLNARENEFTNSRQESKFKFLLRLNKSFREGGQTNFILKFDYAAQVRGKMKERYSVSTATE